MSETLSADCLEAALKDDRIRVILNNFDSPLKAILVLLPI